MALNHEMSSSHHKGNLRNLVANLDSTISQLETREISNAQLQQKVWTLQKLVKLAFHVLIQMLRFWI